jgi:hypothetical protein
MYRYIQQRGRLTEEDARWFFQQIIIGLDYCHRRGVVNRDLKLENLLLRCVWGGEAGRRGHCPRAARGASCRRTAQRATAGPPVLICSRGTRRGTGAARGCSAAACQPVCAGGREGPYPRAPAAAQHEAALLNVPLTACLPLLWRCWPSLRSISETPLQPGQVEEPRNLHCKIAGALRLQGQHAARGAGQQHQRGAASAASTQVGSLPRLPPGAPNLALVPAGLQTSGCARMCRPRSPGWARCTTWLQVRREGVRQRSTLCVCP